MNKIKYRLLLFWVLVLLAVPVMTEAAIEPGDFSCRGIALGDDGAAMLKVFGEPLFDKETMTEGVRVKYYTFRNDFVIGVSAQTNKVVDISITNHDYTARDGVRYGATPYKITQVYGRTPRAFLDGGTYYIYRNPLNPRERLLLCVDSTDYYLLSMRITSLPLTDDEALGIREDGSWTIQQPSETNPFQEDSDGAEHKTSVRLRMKG